MGHANDIAQRWQDELLEKFPQCAAFLCPITKVLMLDPVTADDGCTYERKAIESWLETNDLSPMKRGGEKQNERVSIGKQLTANAKMKEDIDSVRAGDRSGLDSQSASDVPPPMDARLEAADVTSDLTKMFKILDPLQAELKSLANLTPPKIVVIGDESSGKSTVLEQLIRMPLFPRKQEFCTRLPIHVRLRRPEPASNDSPSVKMSEITAAAYAENGYDAEPLKPPVTIAIAKGYSFVQDRMDALSKSGLGGETGIVTDRIIVLDVLHPMVPVLDLVDLPGIVSVDVTAPGKVEAVETVISAQIDADKAHGMTSFYLIIVPSSKPNTNCALKYIKERGLLDCAIGVLTKADELRRPEDLRAWIKGGVVVDEEDDSVRTAAALGQVEIAKGWTATMLKMPKRMVDGKKADDKKVNYYLDVQLERLEKQKADEKQFFGGENANHVMRELYNEGLAGCGALAAKLNYEYYEYCRTVWLERTLTQLLQYELQLQSERALLGVTDPDTKDELAAKEVASTLDDGAKALTQRFVSEMLLAEGKLFPEAEEAVNEIHLMKVPWHELDSKLSKLQSTLKKHVAVAAEAVETFYADEFKKMLDAPIRVSMASLASDKNENSTAHDAARVCTYTPAPGPLELRFWKGAGVLRNKFVRSLFGTKEKIPEDLVELHKKVIAQPIIQLGAYPEYTSAIAAKISEECAVSKEKIKKATSAVLKQVTADASFFIRIHPTSSLPEGPPLLNEAQIILTKMPLATLVDPNSSIIDALQAAFLRHLPNPEQLKAVVMEDTSLKLSKFEEDTQTAEKRDDLDKRLDRVQEAMRGLRKALDVVDKALGSTKLNKEWLNELQKKAGLPQDDRILQPPIEPEEASKLELTSQHAVLEGIEQRPRSVSADKKKPLGACGGLAKQE